MKKLASILPASVKLALLKRHLARSVAGAGSKRLMLASLVGPAGGGPLPAALRKDDSGIVLSIDTEAVVEKQAVYRMLYARLPVVLDIFSRTAANVGAVAADLSDGGHESPGALAFCSGRDDVILVPDPVFYNSDAYAEYRNPAFREPWSKRKDTVLWRGTLTGIGQTTTETMRPDDPNLRQRARMCLILRDVPGADAKFRKSESSASPVDRERLLQHRLVGGAVKQSDWGRHKFALDVDGHTNAWSNFFVRLLLGCCILKIGSEHGFRQWYYDKLVPWQHYVPVRADMSDLIEKIDWCRQNDAKCAEIAEAGRIFAQAMTVESEIGVAVRRLEAARVRSPHATAGVA